MKEIWVAVKGLEGCYEISSFGRVKNLSRKIRTYGGFRRIRERILRLGLGKDGYELVFLCADGAIFQHRVHCLVWDHFGNRPRNGHKLQVDHIDDNKLNNNISNLQLLTSRQNVTKSYKNKKTSSEYTGVSWAKSEKKWYSKIGIKGKSKHLGCFELEEEAAKAYQKALLKITEEAWD